MISVIGDHLNSFINRQKLIIPRRFLTTIAVNLDSLIAPNTNIYYRR
ncbi:MAG: hypothetical protein HC799_09550 [Limnothrix sp. RL_2_0]|nr:hypothetical protein [Limnothrix sp. RL_2_0]